MATHFPVRETKVWLLYLKSVQRCKGRLSLNILREVCAYIHPTTMAGVWCDSAFLYNIQSQQITISTLSFGFGSGGSYIEADRGNALLCVGAFPASSAVHLLDLSSFQLSPLHCLCTPRAWAGLVKVNVHFYVFGGCDGDDMLKSCEKMQFSDKHWTNTNSMQYPRAAFTPCPYRSLIYLVSADTDTHKKVETFHIETEIFTLLSISLPSKLKDSASVAFIANGELCLLTLEKQMLHWKIETECNFCFACIDRSSWSTQQPLLMGPIVLIANLRTVQRFSLETYSFLS